MPGGLHFADRMLARVTATMGPEEKINHILDFLYQLTEQLRYLFEGAEMETALSTIKGANGEELRLRLENGDSYSFRSDGIYYISGSAELLLIDKNGG